MRNQTAHRSPTWLGEVLSLRWVAGGSGLWRLLWFPACIHLNGEWSSALLGGVSREHPGHWEEDPLLCCLEEQLSAVMLFGSISDPTTSCCKNPQQGVYVILKGEAKLFPPFFIKVVWVQTVLVSL